MNTKTQTDLQITEDLILSMRDVGCGKMITSPMYINGWYLVPEEIDRSSIPKECIEIVEQWKGAGIRIQGIVIAHDHQPDWWEEIVTLPQPTPLITPKPEPEPEKREVEPRPGTDWNKVISDVAKIVGILFLVATGIGVIVLLACILGGLSTVGSASPAPRQERCIRTISDLIDPVYIAVLEDEYYEDTDKNLWVMVHQWWE